MITLITGTPGTGKTIYAVWHEIKKAIEKGRTVYVSGIPKLTLPASPLSDHEVRNWYHTCPKENPEDPDEIAKLSTIDEGALVVIDEVQRLWRPAGAGAISPDIAALEIHRHHGMDFVVMTQHPSLLHRNVRALVGKHIHLRKTALGSFLYEFPEWCENPQTKGARTACVSSRYKLPKAAFDLYESASLHVKTSKRLPVQLLTFFVVLLLLPVGGYFFVNRMVAKTKAPGSVALGSVVSASAAAPSMPVLPEMLNISMVSNQVDWTKVAACIASSTVCRCYGDAAERLAIPDESCRSAIKNGWSGRPRLQPAQPTTRNEEAAQPVVSPVTRI